MAWGAWAWGAGWEEGASGICRPEHTDPRGWVLLGPRWLWVTSSRLCQPPEVREGIGESKKSEGPG